MKILKKFLDLTPSLLMNNICDIYAYISITNKWHLVVSENHFVNLILDVLKMDINMQVISMKCVYLLFAILWFC